MMDIAAAKKRCEAAVERAEEQVRVWGDAPASADVLMLAEALEEAQTWRDDARQERDAYMKSYDAACKERDEAQGKLEALVKATQPMDFCHVCLSVHSNFKDAADHKEWCAWDKADSFLRGSKEDAPELTNC